MADMKVTEQQIEAFYLVVSKFTLASNLFWVLWTLIQAEQSQIDLDYLELVRIDL